MNEGKPTQDPSARPTALSDGDYELERPEQPDTAAGAGTTGASAAEYAAASAAGASDAGASDAGASDAGASGAAERGSADDVVTGDSGVRAVTGDNALPSHDGDFELRRAEEGSAPVADAVPAEDGVRASAAGTHEVPAKDPAPTEDAMVSAAGAQDAPAPPPQAAERVRPLHDPDPYSTPPYGEPGPWAPAPPVQHPATTPPHGTAIPAPPVSHGGEIPAPGAPGGPCTTLHAPAPGTPVAGAPLAGAPMAGPLGGPLTPPPTATAGDPWRRYDPWAAAPLQQTGEAMATAAQRKRRGRKTLVLGALLLALVSGIGGGVVGTYLERNGGVGAVELPQAGEEPAGRDPDSVAGIAARTLPSVVTLHVRGSEQSGTGTGFVLDDRGHILTNNHVVEPAGKSGRITVTFHSGDTAEAEVVGGDSGYDLAVVKVSGVRGLQPAPLGNSDNVQVGDPVVAIGAPFDLAGTVTSGIISAKQRPITAGGEKGDGSDISYVDALQTDAPINPGNSGGPLLDSRGRVIGINSAIRSADSGSDSGEGQAGSIGLGFAIPVNQGKRVAEELINTGRATHPVIGVTLDMDYTGDGARVGTKTSDGRAPVTVGGPGARAGIEAGDVITEVDGQRVHSGEELIVKTRAHRPGDRLELTVERDGEERAITLVLGSSDDG
ncbi:trypsin-like peptidase domain-containing protein [Streptomyces sp. NPDC006458]|uniref:S1C family serine protease n=1 Tax=Streptomyces sp. NPDC006458 TaxID=3154302 RepID=UPI0033AA2C20